MKFLEKIEDAINAGLEKLGHKLFELLKAVTPEIIPHYYHELKKCFPSLLEKIKALGPKLKILGIKIIGYSQHYIHIIKGKAHASILYLRSEEFKKANKKDLLLSPLLKLKGSFKVNPVKTSLALFSALIVIFGAKIITKEILIVNDGLKKLRAPASSEIVIEEDNKLDLGAFTLKKLALTHAPVHSPTTGKADDHAPPAAKADNHAPAVQISGSSNPNILTGPETSPEKFEPKPFEDIEEIAIDIKLKFVDSKTKNKIESNHKLFHEIKHSIQHIGVPEGVSLPLDEMERKIIVENFESHMKKDENTLELFQTQFVWEINQEEVKKPRYHLAYLRQHRFIDVGLQLLLEETKRNRQVYFEFVIQTINREGAQFIKHHEVEIKDHLMMNVEPVVPGLPLDDEGKRIIRDKIKFEVNNYLKLHHIESTVEEVFIDYILAS